MLKRAQLHNTHLRRAIFKAPLILLYFVAPFLAGIILSPSFAKMVNTPEFLGAFGFALFIAVAVYLNGFLGCVLFGGFLFFFLNAIKMQNRWIYWLVGISSGMVFNLLYPYYNQALKSASTLPGLETNSLNTAGLQTFPVFFGLCGLAVAWSFWREVSKGGEIDAH